MVAIVTGNPYNMPEGKFCMTLKDILEKRNMTPYHLSKISNVPYSTVNDLYKGISTLEKCSAGTIYKIMHALGLSTDMVLVSIMEKRPGLENFKREVRQGINEMGEVKYVISVLGKNVIDFYMQLDWHIEALYLLATIEYLCHKNHLDFIDQYDYSALETYVPEEAIYPEGIGLLSRIMGMDMKERVLEFAIPEYMKYNIIEYEMDQVV
ncbi:Cro/C1-type HTH DNA-binding domain-containing protein [Kandleria vitulina]|nr:Cro/C1-type HTH DNA-binding domain-containing protein [Kandleria vitulina]